MDFSLYTCKFIASHKTRSLGILSAKLCSPSPTAVVLSVLCGGGSLGKISSASVSM